MALSFRALVFLPMLVLSACDNHSAKDVAAKVGQAVSGDELPAEVKNAAPGLNGTGNLWLDFPYGAGCSQDPADSSNFVGLYYKSSTEPFPSIQTTGLMEYEHQPALQFVPELRKWIINTLIGDAVSSGLVVRATSVNPFWNTTLYCHQLVEPKIGALYQHYMDNTGKEVRGLILAADFVYDGATMVSEFDRARPFQGYVAKHRKYHLRAHIMERSAVGTRRQDVQRDLVIFFNPEDKVWVIDPTDGTNWLVPASQ